MIPKTRTKMEEPESDSDWDSLPGDIAEPNSNPEPNIKSATKSSLSPIPPKQPNTHGSGKYTGATKPVNLYKSNIKSSKNAGNPTAFEDKSGGIWNDEDDLKHSFSKEDQRNNNKNESKVLREKKERRDAHQQKSEKKPPFTDFHEALTTPIPPSQNRNSHHDVVGVNQAYRTDKEDIHETNHDSWDESEHETISQLPLTHEHEKGKEVERNRKHETDFQPPALGLVKHHSYSGNTQFEDCCLIQVSHGPHDDRYQPSFFHGSKDHFHIRKDDPRAIVTEIAEKSEVILQRFWREVFGFLKILMNFFIIFILEFFKVMVHSVQNLITGILYTLGDHFIKPLLSAFFNNIIQPFSILLLNILTIFTNLLKPLLSLTRELLSQIAIPLKAFRLFEMNNRNKQNDSECTDIKVV